MMLLQAWTCTRQRMSLETEEKEGSILINLSFESAPLINTYVLSPTVVSVSDSSPHQIRVSWGPLQPNRVQRYVVEYGAIPSGRVQSITLQRQQNSTLLTGLKPGTQYLVTVSAVHADGKERAMSVRACTQEAPLPALVDYQLTKMQHQDAQVDWYGHQEGLMGYWLSWERQNSYTSSVYLRPNSHSTRLTPGSRVCISPVYSSGRGKGICCAAERNTGWLN
ncbi:von Willebrand factor A domain-containing protein 1 [Collichthys lucidus]|uniref:von Willebrand factor A domain-containing protein 1 n=1 Tax=Collichthys lucidus TaxID=240159 RepID=A0A4U5UBG0_COLLU|nr:von Willebrand factor A domain-containing protein 1 [Collichthys lucidus]